MIGIVIAGIVVLIIALFPGDDDEPTPTGPAELLDPTNYPELEQQSDPAEEPDNAGMVQGGGSDDEALAAAQERVDNGFSYWGPDDLVGLLEIEGYDSEAIDYTLNNLDVDWNEQAAGDAQQLVDSEYNGYSETGIEQYLEYSEFDSEHIASAMGSIDVDYNEQAVAALESYQELFDDSTQDEARSYMAYSGFSDEQIEHAFSHIR